MMYVDPSGHDFWDYGKDFIAGAVGAAVFVLTGGTATPCLATLYASIYGGMAAGAVSGALNGGGIEGTLLGAAMGAAAGGLYLAGVPGTALLAISAGAATATGGLEGLGHFAVGFAGAAVGGAATQAFLDARRPQVRLLAAEGEKFPVSEKSWGEKWLEAFVNRITEPYRAVKDLWSSYQNMRQANTIGADKYFHCTGHCEASREGPWGLAVSRSIGDGREMYGFVVKGDSWAECRADLMANEAGRSASPGMPCREACNQFRPTGLDAQY